MAVERRGHITTRFEALEEICRVSPVLWPIQKLLGIGLCRRISRAIFNLTAILIATFCTVTPKVREDHLRAKRILWAKKYSLSVIGLFFTVYLIFWNLGNFGNNAIASVPQSTLWIGYGFRIDQMWNMFSPHPPKSNWWYTIEGKLDDDTKVEIWKDGLTKWEARKEPFNQKKPEDLGAAIGNHKWVKLYEYINWGDNVEIVRLNFGRYICREWNGRYQGAQRLHTFSLIYHQEENLLDGSRLPLRSQVWWSHMCYEK